MATLSAEFNCANLHKNPRMNALNACSLSALPAAYPVLPSSMIKRVKLSRRGAIDPFL